MLKIAIGDALILAKQTLYLSDIDEIEAQLRTHDTDTVVLVNPQLSISTEMTLVQRLAELNVATTHLRWNNLSAPSLNDSESGIRSLLYKAFPDVKVATLETPDSSISTLVALGESAGKRAIFIVRPGYLSFLLVLKALGFEYPELESDAKLHTEAHYHISDTGELLRAALAAIRSRNRNRLADCDYETFEHVDILPMFAKMLEGDPAARNFLEAERACHQDRKLRGETLVATALPLFDGVGYIDVGDRDVYPQHVAEQLSRYYEIAIVETRQGAIAKRYGSQLWLRHHVRNRTHYGPPRFKDLSSLFPQPDFLAGLGLQHGIVVPNRNEWSQVVVSPEWWQRIVIPALLQQGLPNQEQLYGILATSAAGEFHSACWLKQHEVPDLGPPIGSLTSFADTAAPTFFEWDAAA